MFFSQTKDATVLFKIESGDDKEIKLVKKDRDGFTLQVELQNEAVKSLLDVDLQDN
jgi:hypothetical protein